MLATIRSILSFQLPKIHNSFSRLLCQTATSLPPRERMEFDVVIVGAGCAGLSAAIRLKQIDKDINVCVVEKGGTVGSHVLSGNMFDPKALNELIPDWKTQESPLTTPLTHEKILYLTEKKSIPMPHPPLFNNKGCYLISLGELSIWLANKAEELGVELYPGFAGSDLLVENDTVIGIATNDVGISKDLKLKPTFERGLELVAKHTFLAEGVRGSLSEQAITMFNLRKNCDIPTYGLGCKELWEVPDDKIKPGTAIHTLGFPYTKNHYGAHGGGFLYHEKPNRVHLGFVVGLDYQNPYQSPYDDFQRFKTHPAISQYIKGGKCIGYGARCLNEGGFNTIPNLCFPGGFLIGGSAGFMNVPRLKEAHYAMKSGMLAAEAFMEHHKTGSEDSTIHLYQKKYIDSWVYKELYQVRNTQPALKKGPHMFNVSPFGLFYSGLTGYLLRGKEPFTLHRSAKEDFDSTRLVNNSVTINYPKPDNNLTFDLLSNLASSNVYHEEDQPCHLQYRSELSKAVPLEVSLPKYSGPEQRFCPGKVYEYPTNEKGESSFQINSSNCLHCKCCDIKCPQNFIRWTVPEGGGGPSYSSM